MNIKTYRIKKTVLSSKTGYKASYLAQKILPQLKKEGFILYFCTTKEYFYVQADLNSPLIKDLNIFEDQDDLIWARKKRNTKYPSQ